MQPRLPAEWLLFIITNRDQARSFPEPIINFVIMLIITNVPVSLHLLRTFSDYMLSFFPPFFLQAFPLSASPSSFPPLLPPPAPNAKVSFLSSSKLFSLWKNGTDRDANAAGFGISLTEGKAIFVYYSASSELFIRSFIFHKSLFLILKSLTWVYIMTLKRLNYSSLATAKIHEGSKPWLVPGGTKPWRFASFLFFLCVCFPFSANTH